jgi:hypothetical protein
MALAVGLDEVSTGEPKQWSKAAWAAACADVSVVFIHMEVVVKAEVALFPVPSSLVGHLGNSLRHSKISPGQHLLAPLCESSAHRTLARTEPQS